MLEHTKDFRDQQLGKYRIQRLLGQGGFADVYLGEHIYLHTQAAIKVLRVRLSEDSLQDFLHEARTIARLDHPHIVRVFECDVEDTISYLVMTYAPYGSLRQRHPRGTRLAPAQVVTYVQQIASALQYAHGQKLIHRDIKPENMLIGPHNEILLSDFGLVMVAQSTDSHMIGEMAGTVHYMAPEQLRGKPRQASDQYALGIVAYEWLCGERPFKGNFAEIASQHVLGSLPSLCKKIPGLAPAVETVIFKALAKAPEDRYPSVQAFAEALVDAVRTAGDALPAALISPGPAMLSVSDPLIYPPTLIQATEPAQAKIREQQYTPANTPVPTLPVQPVEQMNTGQGGQEVGEGKEVRQPLAIVARASVAQLASVPVPTMLAPTVQSPSQGIVGTAVACPSPGDLTRETSIVVTSLSRPGLHRKPWLIVACSLAMLLLIGGSVLYLVQAGVFARAPFAPSTPFAESASVTITPDSRTLRETYPIQAVTGTPDVARHQVQARSLAITLPVKSKTVNASGQGHVDATYARGTVFGCYAGNTNIGDKETISAGTVFTANADVPTDSAGHVRTIKITAPITVVRLMDGRAGTCSESVGAIYMYPGAAGNITAYTAADGSTSQAFTATSGDVQIDNGLGNPFTGGQDAQDYTFVQQGDIDSATADVQNSATPDAQKVVSAQLKENERLVGTPSCQAQTGADHAVNERADTVTVSKTFTCNGEAYDYQGAINTAAQELKDQTSKDLGQDYAVIGDVKTAMQKAIPSANGEASIVVATAGTWSFQLSAAQKRVWQQMLKGKQKSKVEALLRRSSGVKQVSIALSGGNSDVFPDNVRAITIIVREAG